MGVCGTRRVFLIIVASSMPLTPGIFMSMTMAATSCSSNRRSAVSASCARSKR